MNAILAPHVLGQALGWSLVHFFWQGATIALVWRSALIGLNRRSAQSRYLVSCVALALMIIAPVATFALRVASVHAAGEFEEKSIQAAVTDVQVTAPFLLR